LSFDQKHFLISYTKDVLFKNVKINASS
jgi:hypothetical protein